MKKIFTIFLMISVFPSFAQENLDNVWLFGSFGGTSNPFFEGSIVNFNEEEPTANEHTVTFRMDFANTSMCDEDGNLLFYTNGRYVGDAEHNIMENGDNLNGEFILGSSEYLILTQGIITVPIPDDPGRYYLFHSGMTTLFSGSNLTVASYPLFYSIVDMTNPDYPLGVVTDKNTVILNDTIDYGKLTMTRHANGRDWWLVTSQWNSNRFYRLLITPEGIENYGWQQVGTLPKAGIGQAVFSPDGTKYARVVLPDFTDAYVNLYDFDRCTGFLTNHRQYYDETYASALGVSISPNSRYLYLATSTEILQYDTEADNVWATEQLVAEYDGYEEEVFNDNSGDTSYIPTTFFLQQLGPDGKIYLNATNSVSSLHVIDQPNEAGAACNVIQRGLDLPALNRFSLPNFPNYRLGRLEGSPCDTLDFTSTAGVLRERGEVKVYPNPNTGQFTVEIPTESEVDAVFSLYNVTGKKMHEQVCVKEQTLVTSDNLPAGVYFYRISTNDGLSDTGKIFISK